jgi:hypothetical protein
MNVHPSGLVWLSLLGLALSLPRHSWAQDPVVEEEPVLAAADPYPLEFIARPNTLHEGMLELRLDAIASLSSGAVFKPFILAPSVNYGINDAFQIGILHSASLCLSGTSGGCPSVYNDITVDAHYNFLRDATRDVNVHAGVDVTFIDVLDDTRIATALRVGVFGSIVFASRLALYFDPFIAIGVTERDLGVDQGFAIPLRLAFQATPELTPFLDVALGGPFSNLGDNLGMPVAIGVNYALSNMFDLGAAIGLLDLLGGDDYNGAFDRRQVVVYGAYRLGGRQ